MKGLREANILRDKVIHEGNTDTLSALYFQENYGDKESLLEGDVKDGRVLGSYEVNLNFTVEKDKKMINRRGRDQIGLLEAENYHTSR